MSLATDRREWLEADGLGGYASGTVSTVRSRRQHGLLVAASAPPGGRHLLVAGFDARVETPEGPRWISAHHFSPDVVHPDGAQRLQSFQHTPWPRWVFDLGSGRQLEQAIFARRGSPLVAVTWKLIQAGPPLRMWLRPLLAARDADALHLENPDFHFEAEVSGERVVWRPYPPLPDILSVANAEYTHDPVWYRDFIYAEERELGTPAREDLASPGVFEWELSSRDSVWILATPEAADSLPVASWAVERVADLRAAERRRRTALPAGPERAVESFLVRRAKERSLIAGYPSQSDRARDAFGALRGLCVATGRLEEAADVLVDWCGHLTDGVVPDSFDADGHPVFSSADASLWFVIAVYELLAACTDRPGALAGRDRDRLREAVRAIVARHGRRREGRVRLDADGLLMAVDPDQPLTWMDSVDEGRPLVLRAGKPVELQALWLNALHLLNRSGETRWQDALRRGLDSFRKRFWNEAAGCLYDVVDVDGVAGSFDATLRPNQILAIGGLPLPLLDDERGRRLLEVVERELVTPHGLRSLAASAPGYQGSSDGEEELLTARHQGGAWPWLTGPFVEAWLRLRGGGREARREARRRFLDPLLERAERDGLGHLGEWADGDAPHAWRGSVFSAWSLGELLRLERSLLGDA